MLLLDWGLAKVWDREGVSHEPPPTEDAIKSDDVTITRQGKLEGTAAYMSPEQIDRDPGIDGRTDVFSLGTILYEILARTRPTKGDTIQAVIQSVLHDKPTKPSEVAKEPVPRAPRRNLHGLPGEGSGQPDRRRSQPGSRAAAGLVGNEKRGRLRDPVLPRTEESTSAQPTASFVVFTIAAATL